jgi:hypothetical protein
MKQSEPSEPPPTVTAENGAHLELWKAVFAVRMEVAGLKPEIRILGVLMTLVLGAIIGRYIV